LAQIRSPRNWTLVPSDRHDCLWDGPHVIRQSGCPLFDIPTGRATSSTEAAALEVIGNELDKRDLATTWTPASLHIEHALTIDEHLAVRLAEVELYYATRDPRDEDAKRPLSLPLALVAGPSDDLVPTSPFRYWMAFGVPVADPAIRHRLMSQIAVSEIRGRAGVGADRLSLSDIGSARAATTTVTGSAGGRYDEALLFSSDTPSSDGSVPGGGDEQAASTDVGDDDSSRTHGGGGEGGNDLESSENRRMRGVVVNRRITGEDANLLFWLGLDVIREETASAFEGDLRHYADHLWDEAGGWPQSSKSTCRLAGASRP
jgi:hypothetical protein